MLRLLRGLNCETSVSLLSRRAAKCSLHDAHETTGSSEEPGCDKVAADQSAAKPAHCKELSRSLECSGLTPLTALKQTDSAECLDAIRLAGSTGQYHLAVAGGSIRPEMRCVYPPAPEAVNRLENEVVLNTPNGVAGGWSLDICSESRQQYKLHLFPMEATDANSLLTQFKKAVFLLS